LLPSQASQAALNLGRTLGPNRFLFEHVEEIGQALHQLVTLGKVLRAVIDATYLVLVLMRQCRFDDVIVKTASGAFENFNRNKVLVPLAGIEPALLAELDFESSASTSSATGAFAGRTRSSVTDDLACPCEAGGL
jgi:hypothetical protein